MTSRMVGSVLTLVTLLFSAGDAAAQTYTQMQWGMNKGVTPYAFGANINGTWRDLGTVSNTGVWSIAASSIGFLQAGAGAVERTSQSKMREIISVKDFGAKGDGSTNDEPAFTAAMTYAASVGIGATVYVPSTSAYYRLNSTVTIPQGASMQCEDGAFIRPGASMTDLFKITANIGTVVSGKCFIVNQSGYATNGIRLEPTTPANNYNTIDGPYLASFTNGIYNVNADAYILDHLNFQNSTAWDIRSVDNGINMNITNYNSLGSAGCIYFAKNVMAVEGVRISNGLCLPTAGVGVKFSGGLNNRIENFMVDQANGIALELDGDSGYGINNMQINNFWAGSRAGATANTYGVWVHGSVLNVNFHELSAATWASCGILLQSTAGGDVARVNIDKAAMFVNGADYCTNATTGVVGAIGLTNNRFESPVSVAEVGDTRSLARGNYSSGTQTWSSKSVKFMNYGTDVDPTTNIWTPVFSDLTTFHGNVVMGIEGVQPAKIQFANATSGTISLQPVTGALGTSAAYLPANSGVVAELNLAQSWTANQTFDSATARIKGSSTGVVALGTLNAGAIDYTAAFPANTGTVAETNLAQTFSAIQTFSSGVISAGTKPTATGAGGTCAAGTVTGGALVGTVALTGVCAATNTLALTSMPAATTGYVCDAADRTSGVVNLVQTATTTTGATFTFNATTGATDVIQFKCLGY